MSKSELMNKATRSLNRLGLRIKKHSPAICVAVGIGTGIAATVSACKATTKLQDVLDHRAAENEKFKKGAEEGRAVTVDEKGDQQIVEYTKEDCDRDMRINKVHTALDVAKLYGPSVVLGFVSIGSILYGYKILNNRYVGVSAALAAVTKDYKGYRQRVVERFGEELDKELKYNLQTVEVEETVKKEDGTEETVKKQVKVARGPVGSAYAIIWDDGNEGWKNDPEHNRFFIDQVMHWANDKLNTRGHLYLNEVLDALGAPRMNCGWRVGWVKDNPDGDGYVDFLIYQMAANGYEAAKRFINREEATVLIDFNVDGEIDHLVFGDDGRARRI